MDVQGPTDRNTKFITHMIFFLFIFSHLALKTDGVSVACYYIIIRGFSVHQSVKLFFVISCQDLHLLDNNLTTARLLEIITAESCDPSNLSSCLSLEVCPLCLHQLTQSQCPLKDQHFVNHFCCCLTLCPADYILGVFRGTSGLCWGEVSA